MTTNPPKLSPLEAAQTLNRVLARAKAAQAGAILIVEFPGEFVRDMAAKELQAKLVEAGDELVEVDLRQQQDLFETLKTFKPNQVASIHGLHAQPDLVRRLNWRREFFGQHRLRVVLWLNPDEAHDLARRSPDFWAFYNRFLQLEAITSELDKPDIYQPSVLELSNLASQSKLDRIAALEELLEGVADPKSERAIGIRSDLAVLLLQIGQAAKAVPLLLEALEISREIRDEVGEGIHLGNLGLAYEGLGNYSKAIEYYQQALKVSHNIGDKGGESNHLGNLGYAYNCLGDYSMAIEHHQQALEISRRIGDKSGEGNHLGELGLDYRHLGDYHEAIKYHQQALDVSRHIGDKRGEGNHLGNLGIAYRYLGDYHEAIKYHQQALEISRHIGDKRGEGSDLGNLGYVYLNLGNYLKAIALSEQALLIARQIGNKPGEEHYLDTIGDAFLQLGNYEKATEYLANCWLIRSEIGSPTASIALNKLHKVRTKWPPFEPYLRQHFPDQVPQILQALAQAQP